MEFSAASLKQGNRDYAEGLARAFGGAIIFSLPLLMTMEMWFLGFYMDRFRLLLFLLLNFAVLIGLSHFAGFERTTTRADNVLDAFAAYGVAVIASFVVLSVFGILEIGMPLSEVVGKVAVQTVPGSFGTMIARKQLSGARDQARDEEVQRRAGFAGQLFLMMAGALFLTFNVAPTEEMILIAFKMSPWQSIALVLFSIMVLHAFVYGVGFAGQEQAPEGSNLKSVFFGYTMSGYGMALLVSLYTLWSFGRTDGADLNQIAAMTAVLGFPAALGAAIARLVV